MTMRRLTNSFHVALGFVARQPVHLGMLKSIVWAKLFIGFGLLVPGLVRAQGPSIRQEVMLAAPAIAAVSELLVHQAVVAQPNPERPRYRYWTTNWSFDDINVGTLLSRLRRFGVEIPVNADGDVSLKFSVSVPLNALRTGQAYRFSGTLSSSRLRLEALQLADFSTKVKYDDGVLALNDLTTRWIDLNSGGDAGTLAGDATLALIPGGDLTASITATRLSVAPVHDLVLSLNRDQASPIMQGLLSGSVAARVPLDQLDQPMRWTVNADLTANNLQIADTTPLTILTGPVTLEQGRIEAPSILLGSPSDRDIRLAASVQANLQGDRPFKVSIRGNDVPLQAITKLIAVGDQAVVTGKLDVDAAGSGALGTQGIDQATWSVEGRLASPQLNVYGVDLGLVQHRFEFDPSRLLLERISGRNAPANSSNDDLEASNELLQRLQAKYQIQESAIELNELDAKLFGGILSGNAHIARTADGKHQLNLKWNQLAPRFNTALFLPASVNVRVQTSGQIDWSMPASEVDKPATHRGTAQISIDRLTVGREDLGHAQLDLQASESELRLSGEGNLFGGSFEVETTSPLAADTSWWDLIPRSFSTDQSQTITGDLRLNSVNLGQANRVLHLVPRQLDGLVSGTVELRPTTTIGTPSRSQARLSLDSLSLDRKLLSRRVNADLILTPTGLQIRFLRGSYAGGQIDAMGDVDFTSGAGRLQVRLAAIDASQGLMLISPSALDWAEGKLSGSLSIDSGATVRARGRVTLRAAKLFAMPTGDAHASLVATAPADFSRWSLTLSSIDSSIGYGRVTGDATLKSSYHPGGFDLSSSWSARRLDFGNLLDDVAGSGSNYTRGNLDGRLTLGGSGIRSVNDLTGRFSAELDGSQGRSIPGLDSAQAYLGAFSLTDTRFEEGGIRGSIGNGVANIEDFWLMSSRMQVVAGGRVALASGYTDIDAVVSTGNFDVANIALLSIAEPLALDAVWPIGLVVRANQLLSNRTLYLQLVGPIHDPRIRLKPLDTLRQGARRFLVREAISAVAPFATAGGSLLTNDR